MITDVFVFGNHDFAEMAHFYLRSDSEFSVKGFVVDDDYAGESAFCGLPLLSHSEFLAGFSHDDVCMFAPLAPRKMSTFRRSVFERYVDIGYGFINYVSSRAIVFGDVIGTNNFILENNVIQPFTTIGDNNVLWSGNHVGHHSIIGSHCMLTSHVVISGHVTVGDHCFFGVNSSIRDSIVVSDGTYLAMNSSLTKDSEQWASYSGNPGVRLNIPSMRMPL